MARISKNNFMETLKVCNILKRLRISEILCCKKNENSIKWKFKNYNVHNFSLIAPLPPKFAQKIKDTSEGANPPPLYHTWAIQRAQYRWVIMIVSIFKPSHLHSRINASKVIDIYVNWLNTKIFLNMIFCFYITFVWLH